MTSIAPSACTADPATPVLAIAFVPLPTALVRGWQAGGPDAYGMVPERRISDGLGVPCRHCLKTVPKGAPYLLVAHRPFPALQPFAETGPLFVCQTRCAAAQASGQVPEMLTSSQYILRGYGTDDRIVYGTGGIVPTAGLPAAAAALFDRPEVAYAHVRSAANTCYQVRIDRIGPA